MILWAVMLGSLAGSPPHRAEAELRSLLVPPFRGGNHTAIAISADGTLLAVAIDNRAPAKPGITNVISSVAESIEDGTSTFDRASTLMPDLPNAAGVGLWNLGSGELVAWFDSPETSMPRFVRFLPGDQLLAAIVADRLLLIWEVATGDVRHKIEAKDRYSFGKVFAVSPDGAQIALTFSAGSIEIRDLKTGFVVHEFPGKGESHSLVYSPDGRYVASQFQVWSVDDERVIAASTASPRPNVVAYAADGSLLYGIEGRASRDLLAWKIATGERQKLALRDRVATSGFNRFALWPGPEFVVATAGKDGSAQLWSARGEPLASFESTAAERGEFGFAAGAAPQMQAALFSQNGQRLVTSCWDGNIQVWDTSFLQQGRPTSAVRVYRYVVDGAPVEETVSWPLPVEPMGETVQLETPLRPQQRVLVREDVDRWYDGSILRVNDDDGKVAVHKTGWGRHPALVVTRSRLRLLSP